MNGGLFGWAPISQLALGSWRPCSLGWLWPLSSSNHKLVESLDRMPCRIWDQTSNSLPGARPISKEEERDSARRRMAWKAAAFWKNSLFLPASIHYSGSTPVSSNPNLATPANLTRLIILHRPWASLHLLGCENVWLTVHTCWNECRMRLSYVYPEVVYKELQLFLDHKLLLRMLLFVTKMHGNAKYSFLFFFGFY